MFISVKTEMRKKNLDIFNGKLHCLQHNFIDDSILSILVDYFTPLYDADSL